MSTDGADPPGRRAARMGIAVSVLFVTGMIWAWPMSFVSAIFAGMFLQGPRMIPGKDAASLILTIVLLMVAAYIGATALSPFPWLLLVAMFAALYGVFRYAAGGGSALVVVFALIALLIVPFLAKTSPGLAGTVALWLPLNMLIAILAANAMFMILPPVDKSPADTARADPPNAPDVDLVALRMTVVVTPYAMFFYALGLDNVLTLAFVALLGQSLVSVPGSARSATFALLLANSAGGLIAILAYEMIVIAPNVLFMAALMACLISIMAGATFSGKSWAPLAPSALNATLAIVGGSMAPLSDDADVKMFDRVVQIAGAVVYLLIALRLVETLLPDRKTSAAEASSGVDPGRI